MFPDKKNNPNYPSVSWLQWFIGFAEGDGAILTLTDRLRFVLTQKEGAVLQHIQQVLGFGNVVFDNRANCYRYIVDSYANVFLLYVLFNGNLVLPHRIQQLKAWYDKLTSRANNFSLPAFIFNQVIPSLNDAWLSGFTDAEGCFNVTIYARKASVTGFRVVVVKFLLDQKKCFNGAYTY